MSTIDIQSVHQQNVCYLEATKEISWNNGGIPYEEWFIDAGSSVMKEITSVPKICLSDIGKYYVPVINGTPCTELAIPFWKAKNSMCPTRMNGAEITVRHGFRESGFNWNTIDWKYPIYLDCIPPLDSNFWKSKPTSMKIGYWAALKFDDGAIYYLVDEFQLEKYGSDIDIEENKRIWDLHT